MRKVQGLTKKHVDSFPKDQLYIVERGYGTRNHLIAVVRIESSRTRCAKARVMSITKKGQSEELEVGRTIRVKYTELRRLSPSKGGGSGTTNG